MAWDHADTFFKAAASVQLDTLQQKVGMKRQV